MSPEEGPIDEEGDHSEPVIERNISRINCVEKIPRYYVVYHCIGKLTLRSEDWFIWKEIPVIIIDLCKEEQEVGFALPDGSRFSPFHMIKRAVNIFVHNKHSVNSLHVFALVAITNDTPLWVHNFTNSPKEILLALEKLEETECSDKCNLSEIFDIIDSRVKLPVCGENLLAPPLFVVRAILIYRRSFSMPEFTDGTKSYDSLMSNKLFFLDIVYAHEALSEDNKCEEIYNTLCAVERPGWSYTLEVSRNATVLHNVFGKLLSHPLQRPFQKDADYTLSSSSAD